MYDLCRIKTRAIGCFAFYVQTTTRNDLESMQFSLSDTYWYKLRPHNCTDATLAGHTLQGGVDELEVPEQEESLPG